MKTPHVHAEVIKAWADGAIIQYKKGDGWLDVIGNNPTWNVFEIYRIKPEPKPDIVRYQFVTGVNTRACIGPDARSIANLMIVFDGETGVLKDAQVLAKG